MARMTIDEVKKARKASRENFEGSNSLFSACWRQYLGYLHGATDNPESQDDIDSWLDSIASEKVNNPRSTFYIYG